MDRYSEGWSGGNFRTYSISLAALLIETGHEMSTTEKVGRLHMFVFSPVDDVEQEYMERIVNDYLAGNKVNLSPKNYLRIIQDLRSTIKLQS